MRHTVWRTFDQRWTVVDRYLFAVANDAAALCPPNRPALCAGSVCFACTNQAAGAIVCFVVCQIGALSFTGCLVAGPQIHIAQTTACCMGFGLGGAPRRLWLRPSMHSCCLPPIPMSSFWRSMPARTLNPHLSSGVVDWIWEIAAAAAERVFSSAVWSAQALLRCFVQLLALTVHALFSLVQTAPGFSVVVQNPLLVSHPLVRVFGLGIRLLSLVWRGWFGNGCIVPAKAKGKGRTCGSCCFWCGCWPRWHRE